MNAIDTRPFTHASFTTFLDEGKLMAARCENCEALSLPPRAICTSCHSEKMAWVELSGNGKLAAFTAVYIGPTFMNEQGFGRNKPYMTGIVELEEGVKISARLLGFGEIPPESVEIGTKMTLEVVALEYGDDTKSQLAFRVA